MRRRLARAALVVAVVCSGLPAAHALDQPLAGRRLVVRTGKHERLRLVTRDRIDAPAPARTDDPSRYGATLEVGNPATGEWARFDLPAAGWAPSDAGTSFRFRSPEPRSAKPSVRRLRLRHGKRLRLRASRLGITLDEARQRTLAVVLTSGSRRYCVLFGGTVRRDEPGRFAARNAAAPASCPETPDGATTTSTLASSTTTRSTTTTSSSSTSSTSTTTSSTSSSSSTSTSTSTSSTSSSTESTTTSSTSSTSSSTSSSSASTSTSTSTSSSSTEEPTTTSSTSTSSTSTSSTSSSTTSTSSTTTSTDYTCGGILFLCGGTCPPGKSCVGVVTCDCQ